MGKRLSFSPLPSRAHDDYSQASSSLIKKKSAYYVDQETAKEMLLLPKAPAAVWIPGNS